ncbi:MAG: hypothetical protein IKR81_06865 [Victivallales bacterium]|nr:hypothetical protein [Victivallales bacterium]
MVTGTNEARVVSEAQRLYKSLAGSNDDPFANEIFEQGDSGPEPELVNSVVRSLKTPPFLGGRKVVWLKHFTGFDQEGDKSSQAPMAVALRTLATAVTQYLGPEMILLVDGDGLDKRRALYKAFAAHGKVMEYTKPDMAKKGWENIMIECIRQEASLKGLRLAANAEQFMLDVLGTDTARIDAELEKVICYRGGTEGTVTLEEVSAVCIGKGEEMAWALGNVLGERNIAETLKVIDKLIAQNRGSDESVRNMLYGAMKFYRDAIRIKVFMAENKIRNPMALVNFITDMAPEAKDAAVARGMDFLDYHVFRTKNLAMEIERYAPHDIIKALRVIRDAMWQTMSSGTTVRMALESALTEIIGVGRPGRFR